MVLVSKDDFMNNLTRYPKLITLFMAEPENEKK